VSTLQSKDVRRGAVWIYAGQVFTTLGQFFIGIILARLLGPIDFGIFIAVTAFTSLLLLIVQFGIPQALLQAKFLDDAQVNGAFWFVALTAVIFVGIVLVAAEPLSAFYDSASFSTVMCVMSGLFLLAPYATIGLALLRRQMRFDRVAQIEMISISVAGASSIVAASLGAGVYSLVLGAYVSMIVNSVMLARSLTWRPSNPRVAPVKPLLSYSGFATLNIMLVAATARVDNMVVGGALGTGSLGLYNRAYSLARIPSDQFAQSLGPLVLGSLARIQEDVERSRQLYFKAVSAISTVSMPFLVVLAVAGPLVVEFLYGQEWLGAGQPLRAMVVGAVFLVLSVTLRGFINAQGLVRQLVPINAAVFVLTIALVISLAPAGLTAIAAGISFREALLFFLMARVLRRSKIELHLADIAYAVFPIMLACSGSLVAGMAVLEYSRVSLSANTLSCLILIASSVFICYSAILLALMQVWRSHAPLANTRDLLAEVLTKVGARLRLSLRDL
jgi:O-antigen/teichoic acid export membrane protein